MSKKLTIGMATYDDFDGVFFTIQALRMYHPICNTDQVEFVVIDNNPESSHGKECKKFIEHNVKGKYIPYTEKQTTFNKYKVVDHASGEYILIIDCHVLIATNGIDYLLNYYKENPVTNNLIQGPLWYDDLKHVSTHFDEVWRGEMYGVWATSTEKYTKGIPFEIPMQGMGLLSFRKQTWKGISPYFKGFGGEEGYIAAKFRQWGGANVCIPQLLWNHRFGRPSGVKYPLSLEDKVWNYFIANLDLYKDPEHIFIKQTMEHFRVKLPMSVIVSLLEKAKLKVLNT